ncbi:short-chain oxidoreductase [Aspergillus terreus]|uniref:Short-chain oxidoreductase n=1 Tax=Aspergillus terreus TaxID=33178 RepID=A0A5M3Z3F2_ASPTE|nr:hypothetical protein ATETN484_0008054800 [Aspergillus terreus]GFF21376.1 short-chain oxidoreductase [Aspergillus terreus]
MANYLITGSARGLGLALATHLASFPKAEVASVFATSRRDNSPGLAELVASSSGRVVFIPLDATDRTSVQNAARQVEKQLHGRGLDVLVNNVGVMPVTRGGVEKMEDLDDTFHANVTSTHMVTQAFLPLLRKGERKLVTNISTTLGSIGVASTFKSNPVPAYKITRAALNMLTKQYADDLADEGFTFLAVSPGWLQTDMGGSRADLPVAQGAAAVIKTMKEATTAQNGKFLNIHVPGWENNPGLNQYDGKEIPW